MTTKKTKRVFAGFYRRYDSAYIQVLTVVDDADTDSKVVFFKYVDTKHADGKNYAMTLESFCEDVEVNGKLVPKFTRYTKRVRDEFYKWQLDELEFNQPRVHRKKEHKTDTVIRKSRTCSTYEDYAKDICLHYNEDINRYNKSVEAKRCVGVMDKTEFAALKEDIVFLKDHFKTTLKDYYPIFKKRYIDGLSIRKCAEVMETSKGSVEYQEKKMFAELTALLKHRDEQDGISRLIEESEKEEDCDWI